MRLAHDARYRGSTSPKNGRPCAACSAAAAAGDSGTRHKKRRTLRARPDTSRSSTGIRSNCAPGTGLCARNAA
ncbi:hypothetical protein DWUX_59 [Desulfovibrio diazotrophicus]|nr:hypothetical protein DWUX_59 [Desulfovibrio diazotrophicus]